MKSLWFKQIYVPDILSGKKTDTIRKRSKRLPAVGELAALSCGPRPPFATARITAISDVKEMTKTRRAALLELYGDDADLVKLEFILEETGTNTL